MAHVIKPKARAAESGAPPAAALEEGEIAVNVPERTIFIRSGGAVVPIANFSASPGVVQWDAIEGKPDTLAGYGIPPIQWGEVEAKPATLAGYGIEDAQGKHVNLTALAGLALVANRGIYSTGAGALAVYALTAGGRALGGVAGTANTFPYFSASNTVALQSITAAGRALLDDADAAAQRATLQLGTAATLDAADVARVNTGAAPQVQNSDVRHDINVGGVTEVRVQSGGVLRKDANSSTMTRQPRFFIRPDDPGNAAEDGDVWMW
ncbi:MAG TPA: hypothetical protein VIG97_07400 [Luteimonas sp.]